MRYLLQAFAVLTLTAALTGTAAASGHSHGHSGHSGHGSSGHSGHDMHHGHHDSHSHHDYHRQHGTKFKGGYLYRGRNHCHWSRHWFCIEYGCEVFYDPCCECEYYFCVPDDCYYPISYCPYGKFKF